MATSKNTPKAIPDGYASVTPFVTCNDARKEIDFLKKALGAEERSTMLCPETKRVMHAEVKVGNSIIMLSDSMPGSECGSKSIKELGGTPAGFYVYVQDVDAAFTKATQAGGKATMPPTDMFWGDRMGSFEDAEGFTWSLATHKHDYTPEQIGENAKAFFESMKTAGAKK